MRHLRRIRQSDSEFLFEGRNHPDVMKWCRQFSPLHREKHNEWVSRQAYRDDVDMFVVASTKGSPLGCCGLTDIDMVNRRAEFSLWIHPDEQSEGHGRHALAMLLAYGFKDLGLNRIWGETFAGNPAVKLFSNMGMEKEGTRREFYYRDGEFIDCHLFSMSRGMFDDLFKNKDLTKWN